MKQWMLGLLVGACALAWAPIDAEAKRLGGGKSVGMQRDMPARTAPDAAPGKPAAPAQGQQGAQQGTQQAAPAAAPNAAAAAATPKRSWMGPIAGLAAGLGLAALMSHLGLGEGFANFLMIVLLALAAFMLIRFVMRRMSPQPAAAQRSMRGSGQVAWPATAAASGASGAGAPARPAEPAEPMLDAAPAAPARPAVAKAFVPAAFDHESFERAAKLIFIRLQAANDAGDLDDLRSFTTPEMFAHARLEIQERGASGQHTDVLRVQPQVLDVAEEGERQVVSVRMQGELREEPGAQPVAFDEVWHLVKPRGEGGSWAVAGIEQLA